MLEILSTVPAKQKLSVTFWHDIEVEAILDKDVLFEMDWDVEFIYELVLNETDETEEEDSDALFVIEKEDNTIRYTKK